MRSAAGGSREVLELIYPAEGEAIEPSRCRFLIEASSRAVEIAIDGDGWRPCRRGDGVWWFDGSGLEPGRHQALIRCEGTEGRAGSRRACRFSVRADPWASIPSG